MGFPDNVLGMDEELIVHCHPHGRRMTLPVAALLVMSGGCGVAGGLISRTSVAGDARWAAYGAVVLMWLVVVGWCTLRPWLRWSTTHLVVTDRRLVFRSGIVRRRGMDVPLDDILGVRVRRSVGDRLVGSGRITVETLGGPLRFEDVPHAARVASVLDELATFGHHEPVW
ncbi:PH domain-containing protein [Tsukamurella sp. 8F]|uniref:PH domain-containing protein n=1 Tax=unclassified Tsukamurella TaxID=2633480 RepID=UPI0023B8ADE2|nr:MULTISPECIES: PH domain-containing protein [unclassified Tsukamurella]MDF0529013.1 PH domain-containing protein [Tsukamurella sp. 8J]MDF0587386.1 PH domain-containing protein [Tsukamurella sp. 8F]